MRIAQVVNSLEVGGLERLAVDLAVTQKGQGHSPYIFCIARRGALADDAEYQGIPVRTLAKAGGFSPSTIWRLASDFRRLKIELVHTHNAVIHHYGVLAARLAGISAVVNTQHGIGSVNADHRLDRIYRAMLPFTKVIVGVSEQTRQHIVRERGVPERKSRTIRNGIPVAKFRSSPASPGRHLCRLTLGTVGRLVPAKDHATLIEAFALVRRTIPHAELRIAGGGCLHSSLDQQINTLSLGHCVTLAGELSDIGGFLSDLDVFVLSSVTEALPVALLEAMAVGLPIVSTRVGGIGEVALDGVVAEYCDPSDPIALATAILKVSSPDILVKMGAASYLCAGERDLLQTWLEYERLFETLLPAKG